MKKQFLIIPALALLASCGGQQNQNSGTATDTTATVETPQCDVSTDTESEPADTISTKVWETLLAFDKKLKERIDEFNREPRFENPNGKSTSKTTYEFSCIYHSEEGGEEIIMGAKLGCFPLPDKSWMVVMVPANIYEHNNIRAYNYSDGKVSKADINKVFPEGFELLANEDYPNFNDYKIDASTFSAELPARWLAKYEWKGSEFRPAQPLYEPYIVDMSNGDFYPTKQNPIRINSTIDNLDSEIAKFNDKDSNVECCTCWARNMCKICTASVMQKNYLVGADKGVCPDRDVMELCLECLMEYIEEGKQNRLFNNFVENFMQY
jgi:hypothetical protein